MVMVVEGDVKTGDGGGGKGDEWSWWCREVVYGNGGGLR